MPEKTLDPTIGALVHVPYGQCYGYPALIGTGRVIETRTYKGVDYVHVEPVSGITFDRWYARHEIVGYVWEVAEVATDTAEAAPVA